MSHAPFGIQHRKQQRPIILLRDRRFSSSFTLSFLYIGPLVCLGHPASAGALCEMLPSQNGKYQALLLARLAGVGTA